MKKILMIFSFMMIIYSGCIVFAGVESKGTRGMAITARKGSVISVAITEISATLDSNKGMPFDLTKPDVEYKGTDEQVISGREIATWSFTSNCVQPEISIFAEDLVSSSNTGKHVKYLLSFYYRTQTDNGTIEGNIIVRSGSTYNSIEDTGANWNTCNSPLMFSNAPVRFMLDDIDIKSNDYPIGDYTAQVTITIDSGNV